MCCSSEWHRLGIRLGSIRLIKPMAKTKTPNHRTGGWQRCDRCGTPIALQGEYCHRCAEYLASIPGWPEDLEAPKVKR